MNDSRDKLVAKESKENFKGNVVLKVEYKTLRE